MIERKKLACGFGVMLVIFGFAILLINAIDYLVGFFGLSSGIKLPSSGIGVVFLVVGWIQIFYARQEAFTKSEQDLAGGD
jgi:nitrate reductase gamma subunit